MLNCQVLSLMECTRLLRSEHWLKNGLPTMLPQELGAFKCDFVGMVLPNDTLQTTMEHVGMINGRKIIKVETRNVETELPVLIGKLKLNNQQQPMFSLVKVLKNKVWVWSCTTLLKLLVSLGQS